MIPEGTVATDYADSLTFVADYNMANVFDLNAMYSTINDEFTGGVTVTAVKPATIVLAWDLNTLSGTKMNTWASVGGTFVPNLYLALDLDYYSYSTGSVSSFGAEAKAEYTLTPMYAIGARVGYSDGNGNGLWGCNLGDILNQGGVMVYPYVKAKFEQRQLRPSRRFLRVRRRHQCWCSWRVRSPNPALLRLVLLSQAFTSRIGPPSGGSSFFSIDRNVERSCRLIS